MTTPSFTNAQDAPLLKTNLYILPPRLELVPRPRLIERSNMGLAQRDWLRAKELEESGEVREAEVIQVNRGGSVVSSNDAMDPAK